MNKEKMQYVKLILWCFMIIGVLICFEKIMGSILIDAIMESRVQQMDRYINDVKNGSFPQMTANNDHAIGIYILGAYIGSILHLGGVETFRFISFVIIYLTILLFPILIYRLFRNQAAAYASPVLLCLLFYDFFITTHAETYVVLGICSVILSIPLILMLDYFPKGKERINIYLALIAIMSVSNIARAHTSLGLLIILICLVVSDLIKSVKEKKRLECLQYIIFLLLMLITYNLFVSTIPNILLDMHGQKIGHSSATAWHNIYIGFGFLNNPYNIVYSDSCMFDKVRELYPEIIYLSDEYFEACKHLVYQLVLSDPFFVIKNVLAKILYTPAIILYCIIRKVPTDVCLICTFVYWFKTRDKYQVVIKKKWIFFWLVLIAAGIFPSILTMPSIVYSITAYASFQMPFILLILYLISNMTKTEKLSGFGRRNLK